MASADKVLEYKMRQTKDIPNLKTIIGQTITPVRWLLNEYTDANAEIHKVLVILCTDGQMYRTEVRNFIEAFDSYAASFAEESEKPSITITGLKSRRGNPYISFTANVG